MCRLIDADELLTAFPVDDEPTLTKSCVRMTIQHMPTIELRKHGRWIDFGDEEYFANCSECGYQMDVHAERGYFSFCPNCGADMRS